MIKGIPYTNYDLYSFDFSYIAGSNIRDYYSLPPLKSMTDLAIPVSRNGDRLAAEMFLNTQHSFPSKNVFEKFALLFEFHSKIPFSFLFLWRVENHGLVGIVQFSDFVRRTLYYKQNPLVYLNGQGKIQGFNRNFFMLFSSLADDLPENLLGADIEKMLQPSPLAAIAGQAGVFQKIRGEKWQPLHSVNFLESSDAETKQFLALDNLHRSDHGWAWRPGPQNRGLLPLLHPLDLIDNDIKLELRFSAPARLLPRVIIGGDKLEGPLFPDYCGYLLGCDEQQENYIIKKGGERVHHLPCSQTTHSPENVLEVFKRGERLALFLNGELQIGYVDLNVEDTRHAFQYLHVSAQSSGTEIVLHHLAIFTLPRRKTDEEMPSNECSARNKTDVLLRFQQLSDARITQVQRTFHYTFVFFDISHFVRNIRSLREQRDRAVLERDRFRELALRQEAEPASFVGVSPAILHIKERAAVAASVQVTILIEGQTGTGKEVLARYIHEHSPFRIGPFIKVDCSALPATLLESELFGFEKGAFTGAVQSRRGKLEEAAGGTLFLDEVGNLSISAQVKLLNFLQDLSIERLGSNKKIKIETRIIAASNVLLQTRVDNGQFRADLFYRMNTVNFNLPALKERKEDITHLCAYFLARYNAKFARAISGISPDGFQKLLEYQWPGNIRELENVIQNAVLFCAEKMIAGHHLNLPTQTATPVPETPMLQLPRNPRLLAGRHILELLKRNHGIVERAAGEAGVSRATFYRKIKKFKISINELF
ncbi:MAG: sigma-54 dependent transcriptional regulator [Fibrobacterota bacterium]